MDINKDGTIDKNDLRGAFDNVGVLMNEVSLVKPCDMSVVDYSVDYL